MDIFINLQLTEKGSLSLTISNKFHKISAEKYCDCREIRLEQISAGVTVLKRCLIT